jgi:putative DNA primase/helicase
MAEHGEKVSAAALDDEDTSVEVPEEISAPAFSEEGLALAFADRHADELRYVAKWGRWLIYDGRVWKVDETRQVFSLARELCREAGNAADKDHTKQKIASAKTRAAVVALVGEDPRLAATTEQWDTDPWLLNTPDGVVDLRNGQMLEHRRADYMTKMTAVAPRGDCPRFKKFLLQIFDGDSAMVAYAQRVLGYALTGVTTEQALFFFWGSGRNGKGVLTNTLRGIWGDYHQTAAMDTFTVSKQERHPTDLAMLRGARLVTSTETEEGTRWAEAKIKAMTGGDPIPARFMRQDFFEYIPQFKLVISGNHRPQLRGVNIAIRQRMNLVPFTVTYYREDDPWLAELQKTDPKRAAKLRRDRHLEEKLKQEWPGILAFMIDGCLEWQRSGLKPPKKVVEATEDYLDNEDTVGAFLEEYCELDPNGEVSSVELFAKWKTYALDNNAFIGSAKQFGGWLAERNIFKDRDREGDRMVFKGLRLRRRAWSDDTADEPEDRPESADLFGTDAD